MSQFYQPAVFFWHGIQPVHSLQQTIQLSLVMILSHGKMQHVTSLQCRRLALFNTVRPWFHGWNLIQTTHSELLLKIPSVEAITVERANWFWLMKQVIACPMEFSSFFFVLILINLSLSTMQCTCITLFDNISVVAHTVGSGLKMKKKKKFKVIWLQKVTVFVTLHLKCPLRWLCLLAQCTGKSMHVPIMVQGQGGGVVVGLYPLGVLLFLVCHTLFKII